jgi:hypothetical protein
MAQAGGSNESAHSADTTPKLDNRAPVRKVKKHKLLRRAGK